MRLGRGSGGYDGDCLPLGRHITPMSVHCFLWIYFPFSKSQDRSKRAMAVNRDGEKRKGIATGSTPLSLSLSFTSLQHLFLNSSWFPGLNCRADCFTRDPRTDFTLSAELNLFHGTNGTRTSSALHSSSTTRFHQLA